MSDLWYAIEELPLWSFKFARGSRIDLRTREDLELQVLTRALTNVVFKEQLLATPKKVVEQELETTLPADLTIEVLEETADTAYFVLPSKPSAALLEENQSQPSLRSSAWELAQGVPPRKRSTLLDGETDQRILTRAWTDEDFKQQLLTDPKAIIECDLGIELPAELTIHAVEETLQHIYIVVPLTGDNLAAYASKELPNSGWFSTAPSTPGGTNPWLEVAIGSTTGQFATGNRGCNC